MNPARSPYILAALSVVAAVAFALSARLPLPFDGFAANFTVVSHATSLDFGIVASLTPEDLYYISENFVALFNQDYRRVAELHVQSGWVPPETRINEFEVAIRSVC